MIDPKVLLQGEGEHHRLRTRSHPARPRLQALLDLAFARISHDLTQAIALLPADGMAGARLDDLRQVFRVLIIQFMDAQNFDVRSVKKSCIHIVHPDGRIIPFDTFNMFYRDDKEQLLQKLKDELEPMAL